MTRPGTGPQGAQAPLDTVAHHPRSLRGIHSAECSVGRESRCLTETGRGVGLCTQAAWLPTCLPDQC